MTGVLTFTGGRRPTAALASARTALCGLPATGTWVWLVRFGALEAVAPLGVVLLDGMSGLVGALGAGMAGHG